MESVFHSGRHVRLYGKLVDKFGDNGVVSVVIGEIHDSALDIQLWLMSCRVLKRDMELAMLDRLVERCAALGIRQIRGHYYPTAKNGMVKELYASFGFKKTAEDKDGGTHWELPVLGYEKKCKVIEVTGNT